MGEISKRKDNMECFGTISKRKSCRSCIYAESCLWASQNPINDNTMGFVSFNSGIEHMYWEKLCLKHPSEEDQIADVPYGVSHLEKLLTVLDTLDKYTLKILGRIITIPDTSIHSLIEWRQCSRQAMHEKMLFAAQQFPFVASVFELTARRIPPQNTKMHWIKRANQEENNE